MRTTAYPPNSIVLGAARPGGLRWTGVAVPPRRTEGREQLRRGMGPIKIRWGLVLVLALGLLVLWGELSPSASGAWMMPR
jgi:hypothetical protein